MNAELSEALSLRQILREDGTVVEGSPIPAPDRLLLYYRSMLAIRILDERMLMRQRQGKVGFYGASTGQEATPTVTGFLLQPQDWVFPALREASIMLWRGFPLSKWIAQVYGNAGDVQKGRQQPMHMASKQVNQVSWSSCLGPQLPQAVGAAWAARARGDHDVVAVAFTGDGATSEPDFHSAMNFAGVMRPPVVIICQNNHWAISVPSKHQTASQTFAIKAHAYGLRGIRVDGNDVMALHEVIGEAVQTARNGGGPTFIESLTYRIGAHSSSDDPNLYRDPDEVEAWKLRDPIVRLEKYLRSRGLVDDASKKAMEAELLESTLKAITEAESFDLPERRTLFEDVYADLPWHLREQSDEMLRHPPAPKHG